MDFYLEQIVDLYDPLADLGVSYWGAGGFYAKQKIFDTITDLGGDLRVVLLVGHGKEQVILASTDTGRSAEEVVRYYRLRYQIEFVLQDAKQHTGLAHC